MNLAALDMNLVVALDALLRERSVTGAAKRMGLSQPAMSHNLTRLRETLGDPLLVRTGRQMALTERAEAMAGPVTALVQDLEILFGNEPPPFNAAESTRTFRVAVSEYAQLVAVPPLHARLAEDAPRASLQALPLLEIEIGPALRSGELDLAIGPFEPGTLPLDVRTEELIRDRLVGLVRVNHPEARGRADLATYAAGSHVVVTAGGARGDAIDDLLARRGLSRRVAVTVSSLLAAPYLVATSDLFATVPERAARAFSTSLPLRYFEPPFDVSAPDTLMAWHERTHNMPMHRWLRRAVTDATRQGFVAGRNYRA